VLRDGDEISAVDEFREAGLGSEHGHGIPASRVLEIIGGRRAISADTAPRLGRYLKQRARILDEPSGALRPRHRARSDKRESHRACDQAAADGILVTKLHVNFVL
jgi:hypothetical protein